MALSIEAIHKPLNDFFLTRFKTDADSLVQFRFDQFGSVVDEDFSDPEHPEVLCSPARAIEMFSELVNHVPIEQADRLHIFPSQSAIDSTYFFRLVNPATAVIPEGADDQTQDAILAAFGAIKNEAMRLWENTRESTRLMMGFRPALAAPEKWYDKDNDGIWTAQSFNVSEASPATPAPAAAGTQLWKLRLPEARFQAVLQAAALEAPAAPAAPAVGAPLAPRAPAGAHFAALAAARAAPAAAAVGAGPRRVEVRDHRAAIVPAEHDGVQRRFGALDFNKRILVGQLLATAQPTQPAATNRVSIAFDYCLVKIQRPWYSDVLVNDKSWCIPGTAKGALTAAGQAGATLPLLPIAVVVIKDVTIEANWAEADLAAAKEATYFGPFKVGDAIVNNKLTHKGLQVIGWLVQRMPELPPNDS